MVDFRSDNTGAARPDIVEAVARANAGTDASYGGDALMARLQARFAELFEAKVRVFPVATGTVANAISLASLGPSWGAVFCSDMAHINTSEVNATGFFGGGVKLAQVRGAAAKFSAEALAEVVAGAGAGQQHKSQPASVSVTQATDLGAVYSLAEVRAIAEVARKHRLRLHMDGARFANALASLGCMPGELTWKSGVDILSFGATKNGGLLCDAIVVFAPELADALVFHLQRAGHTWSKMRFAAAQLLAYVEEGRWLETAARANAQAARIAAGIQSIPGATLLASVEANMVFLKAEPSVLDALDREDVQYFRRSRDVARFVCRYDVTDGEVDALVAALRRAFRVNA